MKAVDKAQATDLGQRIREDETFTIGALVLLYQHQEADERLSDSTHHANSVGFNMVDAAICSSMARQYLNTKSLSPKQVAFLKTKLPKYAGQLYVLGGVVPKGNSRRETSRRMPPPNVQNVARGTRTTRDPVPAPPTLWASLKDGQIQIRFPYDPEMVAKVKSIPGRRFSKANGEALWTAPVGIQAVDSLKEWGFALGKDLQTWEKGLTAAPTRWSGDIPGFKKPLYPFQADGVGFLEAKQGRGLLGDEMGLGKTIQALAWLQLQLSRRLPYRGDRVRPTIVVCPASLKLNWEREVSQCMTGVRVSVLNGKPKINVNKVKPRGDKEVVILNYDILKHWLPLLLKARPFCVILDESHYIKNSSKDRETKKYKTARVQAAFDLCKDTPHMICLSGTPIINRPVEMFNSLKLISPQVFPSFWAYTQEFCGAKQTRFGWDFNGATNTTELNYLLSRTVMLRRLKKDVLKDLPEKVRTVIPMEITNRREYNRATRDFIAWLTAIDPKKASAAERAEALVQIEALKQLTILGKMDGCLEWIRNWVDTDGKLVVFCTHKATVDLLMTKFPKISVKIDGSVSGPKRQEAVDRFQDDPKIRLMIGNIKAAGVGITLTAASNTCFLELAWDPGTHDQAEDRVHRIGQEADSVGAYYLIAENTVEMQITDLLDQKRQVLASVLDGTEVGEMALLTELLSQYKGRK